MRQALWLMAAWALASCGGSGGGMSSSMNSSGTQSAPQACASCGTVLVSLTDASGDFIGYMVNVVSLQLKRSDGTVVETVSTSTQVDFAQLANLSEIVSAEQIPAGIYVSAAITLDFSSATIVVDNGTTGVTIASGNLIDAATSMPLAAPNPTQVSFNLDLGSHNQLVVTPGVISNLALDFDLASSNTIAPSNSNPMTVTVNPVLTASLVPDATKQIGVRGALASVAADSNSFIVNVRPFFNSSGSVGQFTVNTTGATTFSINTVASAGSAGLMQLTALSAGTMVVAYGSWDETAQSFTAGNVLAGSSVPGITRDTVEGTVLPRTFAATRASLVLQWPPSGSTTPFATLSNTELLINQATLQNTTKHYVRIGSTTVDPSLSSAGLQLVPDPSADPLWLSIGHLKCGTSENFSAFADFAQALMTDLHGSSAVVHIGAGGPYDSSSGALSVDQLIVLIND